ncbi:MAG: hypothetical protein OXE77_09550, partial [Flavobacteriaceae bacterium]|nr:hypothetical protein [Flavobacteriaceae bacterium]MCY4267160.1 hypothetical protein [Flavobacteriaceae bacterium]
VKKSQELANRSHSVVFIEEGGHRPHQKIEHGDLVFQEFGASGTLQKSLIHLAGPSTNTIIFSFS